MFFEILTRMRRKHKTIGGKRMKTCAFCGHRQIIHETNLLHTHLFQTVMGLVEQEGFRCFQVGNYGDFDYLAASLCFEVKKQVPDIFVKLVLPYYRPHISSFEKQWQQKFDSVVIPELYETPYPFRILKANQYMVDSADLILCYVISTIGGAAKTLQYARSKGKRVLCYPAWQDHGDA